MVIGTITGDGGAGGKLSGGVTGVGTPMSRIGGPISEGDGDVRTLLGADVPPEEAFFSNRVGCPKVQKVLDESLFSGLYRSYDFLLRIFMFRSVSKLRFSFFFLSRTCPW